ncbi:MAG: hypothetical protein ACP6IU_08655 [Candidatus Asgardarchaeia archaeon]
MTQLIAIDTDVLAIAYLFKRDKRYKITMEFLKESAKFQRIITLYNLLELYGLLVIGTNVQIARKVYIDLLKVENMRIITHELPVSWGGFAKDLMTIINRKVHFSDALIIYTIESNDVDVFVTWNKKHFENKINCIVLTPEEWLEKYTH